MPVFTIFCHGTGGAASKGIEKAEIVNVFSNNIPGVSGSHNIFGNVNNNWKKTNLAHAKNVSGRTDHITLEGVGGAGDPQIRRFDSSTGEWHVDKPSLAKSKVILAAGGIGVDRNVENAINYLQWMASSNMLPTTINMLGWSRGAVTTIRIAYELFQIPHLRHIPVNIFAVDPVAGAGHNYEDNAREVYDNVKNMISIVSVGENRRAFSPMIKSTYLKIADIGETHYIELNFPGVHDTVAKYHNVIGQISFNLAYRFLTHHGTNCGSLDMFKKSNVSCLDAYGKILQQRGGTLGEHDKYDFYKPEKAVPSGQPFVKAMTTGLGRKGREINMNTHFSFFLNSHHEALFQTAYPSIYNSLILTPGIPRNAQEGSEWNRLIRQVGESSARMLLNKIENNDGFRYYQRTSLMKEKLDLFSMGLLDVV